MARFAGSILLDNNAIGDAVDLGVWQALLDAYDGQMETVIEVEAEAGTYFRKKADSRELMVTMRRLTIHDVSRGEQVKLALRTAGMSLDPGERDLWAHAHQRADGWILCGPDKASLRVAVRLGLRDRLVSLEQLLGDAGLPTKALPYHQTQKWLDDTIGKIAVEEALP